MIKRSEPFRNLQPKFKILDCHSQVLRGGLVIILKYFESDVKPKDVEGQRSRI